MYSQKSYQDLLSLGRYGDYTILIAEAQNEKQQNFLDKVLKANSKKRTNHQVQEDKTDCGQQEKQSKM